MNYPQTIENIHQITREMLNFSQQNEWEKVVEIERERQELLTQLANIQAEAFDEVSEKLLQKIIVMNTEIEALSRQEMENCQQQFTEVQNKKSAISAYSSL